MEWQLFVIIQPLNESSTSYKVGLFYLNMQGEVCSIIENGYDIGVIAAR